jgi:VanZ family protein
MKIRKLLVAWGPVAFWMGLIFFLSSQPNLPSIRSRLPDTVLKKAGHITEYAVLSVLNYRALRKMGQAPFPTATLSFVISVAYAVSDEYHQLFVPGRNGRPLDVFFDMLGTIAGVSAVNWWTQNRSGAGCCALPAPDTTARPAGRRDSKVAGGR